MQKHVSGFGGDPSNVALTYQSAGAVATTKHLHANKELFTRFISMSGSYLPQRPLSLKAAEKNHAKAIKALDLDTGSSDQRFKAQPNMDPMTLCMKCFQAGVQDSPV